MTGREPRTVAGRRLLLGPGPRYWPEFSQTEMRDAILAIEDDAADPAGLDVERMAVVGAARRFLAAHDRVVGSEVVTRDDTFAMKDRADELRDVLAFYDENAALPSDPEEGGRDE